VIAAQSLCTGGRLCGALRVFVGAVCAVLFCSAIAGPAAAAERMAAARLRPPAVLQCARNDLTSHTGALQAYHRSADATRIRIGTDEGTSEVVELQHPHADPSAMFLLNGADFSEADWRRIESSPGVARPGLRLTAWVCLDGRTPAVIDWQLPD
jgi:hypothetical protein